MSRRESREAAVQTLFAMDLNSESTLDDMFLTVESEREKLSAKRSGEETCRGSPPDSPI